MRAVRSLPCLDFLCFPLAVQEREKKKKHLKHKLYNVYSEEKVLFVFSLLFLLMRSYQQVSNYIYLFVQYLTISYNAGSCEAVLGVNSMKEISCLFGVSNKTPSMYQLLI